MKRHTPSTRAAVTTLSVTLAIQALVLMAAVAVPVLAPAIAKEFGVPGTFAGLFVGAIYASAIAGTLLSGRMIARYGAIRVSQMSLLFAAFGLWLLAVGGKWALLPGAVLIGIGYGPVTPASSHVLIKTVPRHMMSFAFSLKQTGVPLGGAMAGMILPSLGLGRMEDQFGGGRLGMPDFDCIILFNTKTVG